MSRAASGAPDGAPDLQIGADTAIRVRANL